jgi:hypothetical protein
MRLQGASRIELDQSKLAIRDHGAHLLLLHHERTTPTFREYLVGKIAVPVREHEPFYELAPCALEIALRATALDRECRGGSF